jgi:hypothetical protein
VCSRGKLCARRVRQRPPSAGLTTSDKSFDLASLGSVYLLPELGSRPQLVLSFIRFPYRFRYLDMDNAVENSVASDAKMAEILEDISEAIHQHPRRDLSFYLVLILAVLPLWSVVPLSWAFVIYTLWTGNIWFLTWKGQAIFALALVEV